MYLRPLQWPNPSTLLGMVRGIVSEVEPKTIDGGKDGRGHPPSNYTRGF